MRYFTKEMWEGLQNLDDAGINYPQKWTEAFQAYREQLASLRDRVSSSAFEFFTEVDIHDAALMQLNIIDERCPAPSGGPMSPWSELSHPLRVELRVLDAYEKFIWTVVYSSLRRVVVDFPSSDPLFYDDGMGVGDWGYDELTDVGNGFLRHEILFRCGSIFLFEFKHVEISKRSSSAA